MSQVQTPRWVWDGTETELDVYFLDQTTVPTNPTMVILDWGTTASGKTTLNWPLGTGITEVAVGHFQAKIDTTGLAASGDVTLYGTWRGTTSLKVVASSSVVVRQRPLQAAVS